MENEESEAERAPSAGPRLSHRAAHAIRAFAPRIYKLPKYFAPVLTVVLALAPIDAIVVQYYQYQFEQQQRAVEITFGIGNMWDAVLTPDNRYRLFRVIAKLDTLEKLGSLDKGHARQKRLLIDLVDEQNVLNCVTPKEDPDLYNLIDDDIYAAAKGRRDPRKGISDYRATLLCVLNMFESVAAVRQNIGNQRARDIIDRKHWHNVGERVRELRNFIAIYNKYTYPDGSYHAWIVLTSQLPEQSRPDAFTDTVTQHDFQNGS